MASITTQFEELPLTLSDGTELGLLDGSVEISYLDADDWWIETITLCPQGHEVPFESPLFYMISPSINKYCQRTIEDAIVKDDDYHPPPTDWQQHNTMYRGGSL
jgi:hypothetical protein